MLLISACAANAPAACTDKNNAASPLSVANDAQTSASQIKNYDLTVEQWEGSNNNFTIKALTSTLLTLHALQVKNNDLMVERDQLQGEGSDYKFTIKGLQQQLQAASSSVATTVKRLEKGFADERTRLVAVRLHAPEGFESKPGIWLAMCLGTSVCVPYCSGTSACVHSVSNPVSVAYNC